MTEYERINKNASFLEIKNGIVKQGDRVTTGWINGIIQRIGGEWRVKWDGYSEANPIHDPKRLEVLRVKSERSSYN